MNLFMAALTEQTYDQVISLVERLHEIIFLQGARKETLPPGTKVNYGDLNHEEEQLEERVLSIARRYGINTQTLSEFDREVTAFHDLLETIRVEHPEYQNLIKSVGDYVLPASEVPYLLGEFSGMLSNVDVEHLIENRSGFALKIPAETFRRSLNKFTSMLQFCADNGYAMLGMIEGEI